MIRLLASMPAHHDFGRWTPKDQVTRHAFNSGRSPTLDIGGQVRLDSDEAVLSRGNPAAPFSSCSDLA